MPWAASASRHRVGLHFDDAPSAAGDCVLVLLLDADGDARLSIGPQPGELDGSAVDLMPDCGLRDPWMPR